MSTRRENQTSQGASTGGLLSRPGRMTARMNAASMGLFAFAVFFGTLAAAGSTGAARSATTPWIVGLVLVVLSVLAAGAARSRWGIVISALVLAVTLVVSFQIYAGPLVVGMFAIMWVWLLWVGIRIDADRVRDSDGLA